MLIRTTLVALNQANFTGNYTVLRELGSPELQAKNSTAQLANAFATLRNQRLDMSRVLIVSPEVTETPALTPDGVLRIVGFFPTKPLQINFAMLFKPVAGVWRVDGLSISTTSSPAAGSTKPSTGAGVSANEGSLPTFGVGLSGAETDTSEGEPEGKAAGGEKKLEQKGP